MQLNIPERIVLIDLLPKEGHYADIVTIRRARETLAITPDEIQAISYREEEGDGGRMAYFDVAKANSMFANIPLDEWITMTIQSVLAKKEKEGKMEDKFVSLYEKFVINYG